MSRMLDAKKKAAAKKPAPKAKKEVPAKTTRAKKAAVEEKPARNAKTARTAKPTRSAKPEKTSARKMKALETKVLLISEVGVTAIEGTLAEMSSSFVSVVHKNRVRPGPAFPMKRSPTKALDRGVPVPGTRHFVTTVPMCDIVSIHTDEENNAVVTYRKKVIVDRIIITGDITPIEGGMLQVTTTSGQTVIVSGSTAEITAEVSGSGRTANTKLAKKVKAAADEEEDEGEGEEGSEDDDGEDGEEDKGEGEEDGEGESSDDDDDDGDGEPAEGDDNW